MRDYIAWDMWDDLAKLFGNSLVILLIIVILTVSCWKLFQKAGYHGWEAIVPFYNNYILAEIAMGNGWLCLLTFVPCVGGIYSVVVTWKLGKAFQMGTLFCLGLLFFPYIFFPILAFSNVGFYRKPYNGGSIE